MRAFREQLPNRVCPSLLVLSLGVGFDYIIVAFRSTLNLPLCNSPLFFIFCFPLYFQHKKWEACMFSCRQYGEFTYYNQLIESCLSILAT